MHNIIVRITIIFVVAPRTLKPRCLLSFAWGTHWLWFVQTIIHIYYNRKTYC